MLPRGRVDADDPQPAEVALAHAAVAIGVLQAVLNLLLRALVDLRLQAPVAGGLVEDLAALLARVDGSLDACHGRSFAQRSRSRRLTSFSSDVRDGLVADGRRASASASSSRGCASCMPCRRVSLPLPVSLKRFLAPEWVLFGHQVLVGSGSGSAAAASASAALRASARGLGLGGASAWLRACASASGSASARLPAPRSAGSGVGGLSRGASFAPGFVGGSSLTGASIITMLRPSWIGSDSITPSSDDIFCEPFEQRSTALGVAHLAPAEHDRDLDLVALAQEAYDMALLGRVVVGIDLRAELDLLDRDRALVLARQLLLLLLVVLVLQ